MYSGVCPECKCDTGCLLRGDCCPDLYFSLPELSCVNRTIIEGNSEENRTRQSSALMVTSCPNHSDKELREKCTSLTDTKSRLIHLPVTGNDWPLSFYNKFCAECNGVTNYTSWALDIDCKITADFNYMSSLDEIIDAAFSNKCLFQAYRDFNESEAKEEYCFDENEKGSVISECPKKGFAKQNDLEIKHACECSYKLKFRIFKNVFCYMCNPAEQIFMTKNLDTCNETGQWLTLDRDLQRACQELPSSPYTQPYKNIFCYLCNRGHDPQRSFLDIHSELTETILEVNERDLPDNYDWHWPTNIEFRWLSMMENDARWRYGYQLKIKAFDLTFFKLKLLRQISEESDSEKVMTHSFDVASFRDKNGVERNMTKMLLQGLALNGTLNICNSRRLILPTDKFNTCECELSCIFGPNPAYCCLDLALETPVNCFDIGQFSSDDFSHPHYLTLNGCLQEKRFKIFERECSNPKSDDIFSSIPLTKENSINFANFYCVLCNLENNEYIQKMNMRKQSSSKHDVLSIAISEYLTSVLEAFTNVVDSYGIWNLEIACYKPLDYSHILTAGDFLQLSRRMRCRIRYEPIGKKSTICTTKYSYTNCEIPSKWTFTDKDVQWACKNASALGIWNSKLNKSFPKQYDIPNYRDISSDATYKNLFCALCKPEFNSLEMLDRNCTKQQYESQCLDVPVIYYYYPFKNVYCARCHGIENGTSSKPIPILSMTWNRKLSPPVTGLTWFPLLRNLFSVSDFETEDEHEHTNSSTRCGRNQVFDNNQTTESILRKFLVDNLHMDTGQVNDIKFDRVHRLNGSTSPRFIIAKFGDYKQREMVRHRSKELRGTRFYINEHFPAEVNDQRRELIQVMKEERRKGKTCRLVYNKLYIDNVL
ncbi:hypothetical protein FSP39_020344 [Pinctada imbricata]|uniref:SMB domain-containing protein n=1 Tax=Pinctada imbricata TaxID=66713 RepID=A0AA88YER5_PINIB|nr:hypothetical protein FSP39_020344 [Pinctada imbricata]